MSSIEATDLPDVIANYLEAHRTHSRSVTEFTYTTEMVASPASSSNRDRAVTAFA